MSDLDRFLQAQSYQYETALKEIQNGRKQSHWMWYIFPQLRGLGQSSMAWEYGIADLEEAKAYLAHPILGARLLEICNAALNASSNNAVEVFGFPDNLKLRSSMTLFEATDPQQPIFGQILMKFFNGERDLATLRMLSSTGSVRLPTS